MVTASVRTSRVLACLEQFEPATFIGLGWTAWRGPKDGHGLIGDIEQDVRSVELTELNWTKVHFDNCFTQGETRISGEEMLRRREASGQVRFGGNVFLSLWRNYKENEASNVLSQLPEEIKCLDFPGLILRSPHGDRRVLCFYRDGDGWALRTYCLSVDWLAGSMSGVLAK